MPNQTQILAPIERAALSVREAAQALNLSRNTLYRLIGAGKLKALHVGRRTLIDSREITAFLTHLRKASR